MRKFVWVKLGKIFDPKIIKHPLAISHAANPACLKINKNLIRVFFASRNIKNQSSIFFFDFDLNKFCIKKISQKPIHSSLNTENFYDGVIPGNVFEFKKNNYISTMIWRNLKNKTWKGYVAILKFNKSNDKIISKKIIFKPKNFSIESASYPFILVIKEKLKIFLGITKKNKTQNKDMIHILKSFISNHKFQIIDKFKTEIEENTNKIKIITRPTLIQINNKFHMWYSYRNGEYNDKYKIGYAYYYKKKWFITKNKNTIKKSNIGWDSKMVEYPNVFIHKKFIYMLYNGNNYGKTGIGLARAKV